MINPPLIEPNLEDLKVLIFEPNLEKYFLLLVKIFHFLYQLYNHTNFSSLSKIHKIIERFLISESNIFFDTVFIKVNIILSCGSC